MERNYVAFISYRHAEMDSAIAKTLHTAIEQYRIPKGLQKNGKKRLGLVFRDEEELHAASDLTAEIQLALENTEFLIVICSENSIQSPWVGREITYFLQHHDRSKVLAVLASGEPNEVFPQPLTHMPDGQIIEPLALDVRADTIAGQKKKIRKELPRLISSLLDCPYDALVMREQKRKTRRILSLAAGIMAILLGIIFIVSSKNQQIALANTQLEQKNTQLNEANTALAEQKAAVQLRESQLLVQNAKEDLENADYYGAIETALSALPQDANDNRPYYAPAENILMDAMSIFQTQSYGTKLNTTVLEQSTNITDYVISEDGSRIVTVDEFGTVSCFDTKTAELLWHQYAIQEDSVYSTSMPHLFLCNQEQTVICNGKQVLNAYDFATGKLLWTTNLDIIVEDYLFYHSEKNTLMTATYHTVEIFSTAYQLVEVSTTTGEILQEIPLCVSNNSTAFAFSASYTNPLSESGAYSNDGTEFYGAYFDDEDRLHCFLANLTDGTISNVYSHDTPMPYSNYVVDMFVYKDGRWSIVCKDPTKDIILRALTFDMYTGRLLWQQDIPLPDTFYSTMDPAFCLFLQNGTLIGCNDTFYYLESSTGKILNTTTVTDEITSLKFISDTDFGFSLGNGTYGIGWVNQSNQITLTTDRDWQVFVSLNPAETCKVWGGGIVQLDMTDDSFWLGVGNSVSPGYVTLIPNDRKNTIEIVRAVDPLRAMEHTLLELPLAGTNTSSNFKIQQVGSLLVAGPFSHPEDRSTLYYYFDPLTGQITGSFNHKDYYSQNTLFWIPDTMEPIVCDPTDGIYTLAPDESPTMIYDFEAVRPEFRGEDDWLYSYSLSRCAAEYQEDGKELLSAICTPTTLEFWKNGQFQKQTDLPEALLIPAKESSNMTRLLKVGTNGWILTSLHEYNAAISGQMMAAYDSSLDTWTLINSNAIFSDANAIALAKNKSIMAGVDQDSMLSLYDLNTGNCITRFPTQLPSGSVLQMRFFLDDTHLAIKASGGHVLIYELATGTLVYRDQLPASSSTTLDVFEDALHQRIYLTGGVNSGICLARENWEVLNRGNSLVYYDSNTDLLYLSANLAMGAPVVYNHIPDTQGLVELAKTTLSNAQ